MPRYWILAITEDNYLITRERGLIGITKHAKNVIYRMAIGDILTFYISRKRIDSPLNNLSQQVRTIRGIARVTGEPFESDEPIWYAKESEVFPHRRAIEFLSDAATNAKPLLQRLSPVADSTYWARPLRKGYMEINRRDFDSIQAALQQSSNIL